eukprot:m51a1_g2144 hypothetical protein (201) ;mRNA; r:6292-6894
MRARKAPFREDAVDFLSDKFDAALALRTRHVRPPRAVQPLDHIDKCRCLLPPADPNYRPPPKSAPRLAPRQPPVVVPVAAAVAPALVEEARGRQLEAVHALASAASPVLAALREWAGRRERVCVVVRRVRSVRAVLTGRVVAFDKHWNMVLADVAEEFRAADAAPVEARRVPQLFVKGDGVVDVYLAKLGRRTASLPEPE